ncbi:MAG: four helix bundle protein [Bacteroidia bacterium]
MKATGNVILDHTFEFAIAIISFTYEIEKTRKFAVANQLLKSGTSIGANANDAQSPESKADFIHKLKISAKEAQETEYWLMLCKYSDELSDPGQLIEKVQEICKILTAIISTSKNRL